MQRSQLQLSIQRQNLISPDQFDLCLARRQYRSLFVLSITGSQGSGKSLAVQALSSVFGQYFMRTSDLEKMWDKCSQMLLVNLNELPKSLQCWIPSKQHS
mmetsp:Transcript_7548/g.13802  ORF Transcript_7548/g.13802 Transcript_7548/m.13802 type:complete len:100 (+) Transcript_7548:4699-4998(+)